MPDRVIRVAVPVPLYRLFDYALPPDGPDVVPGALVQVPFSGRILTGVCVDPAPADAHPSVKAVTGVLDPDNAFGEELLALGQWMASYYHHPLGEVLATMLPAALRRGETVTPEPLKYWRAVGDPDTLARAPRQRDAWHRIEALGAVTLAELRAAGIPKRFVDALADKHLLEETDQPSGTERPPDLTAEQQAALDLIDGASGFAPIVLEGITGSGKTEVYLRAIANQIERGRQALVLVPEIALTPQTVARFRRRFGGCEALHSNLADSARARIRGRCAVGDVQILIGTRSAIFTPFPNLGLIVVDEEHDGSFKQTDGLRYSARDIAVKRAQQRQIALILGSATPSLETLHNAERGRYARARLSERPGHARPPDLHLLDIRGAQLEAGLSPRMLNVMDEHLDAGNQVLVFLNRRGFAPTLLCGHCNWSAECPDCEAHMTLHRTPHELRCHHCNRRSRPPDACPGCGSTALIAVGTGTQRTAAFLEARYPDVPVLRIDRDTTRSQAQLEERLNQAAAGERAILVGTQMLAKGHHFPAVTLVAVINADGGLFSPDFRAGEHTAQLIVQVAGRAGRESRPGEVWIQTWQPDNPHLKTLIDAGYPGYARSELDARTNAGLPPAKPLALVRAEALLQGDAMGFLVRLRGAAATAATVLGPAPAPIARVADRHRCQLLVIGETRTALHHALTAIVQAATAAPAPRTLRWSLDVEPYDTL